jgi:hypothetical protein
MKKNNNTIRIVICFLFLSVLLLSGCNEHIVDKTIELGQEIGKEGKKWIDGAIDFVTDASDGIIKEDINIVQGIASLPTLDNETIDTSKEYHHLADAFNMLFNFLNREAGYDIQILKETSEEYKELSKFISKYVPLIKDYNKLIYAARNYDGNNSESVENYYKALGIFTIEIAVIYATVWHSTIYNLVGTVYRASGLSRLAFRCPSLISFILSKAYWGLHAIFVNMSSSVAEEIMNTLQSWFPDEK